MLLRKQPRKSDECVPWKNVLPDESECSLEAREVAFATPFQFDVLVEVTYSNNPVDHRSSPHFWSGFWTFARLINVGCEPSSGRARPCCIFRRCARFASPRASCGARGSHNTLR